MASIQKFTVNSSSRTKIVSELYAPGVYGVKNEGPFPAAFQYKNDADSSPIVGTILSASYVLILEPGETVYMRLEDGTGSTDDLCASCIIDSNVTTIRVWSAF